MVEVSIMRHSEISELPIMGYGLSGKALVLGTRGCGFKSHYSNLRLGKEVWSIGLISV